MNRRRFLGLLGAAAAGLALDPERALWTPGKVKTFDLGAMPKGHVRDEDLGISMRFVKEWDIATDRMPARIDVLYGMVMLRPDLAVRISA